MFGSHLKTVASTSFSRHERPRADHLPVCEQLAQVGAVPVLRLKNALERLFTLWLEITGPAARRSAMATFTLLAMLLAAPLDKGWTFADLGEHPEVQVENINGLVEVEGAADASGVEVRASARDAGDFAVEATKEGGRVRVRVRCPDRHCNRGEIDLRLRVPASAKLQAANVAGKLRVAGVEGPQSLSNVSGDIDSRGSNAELSVNSVSGQVKLEPRALRRTRISTVSGDVTLAVPQRASASIRLSSLIGEIRGEGGRGSRSHRTFGEGEAKVSVSTVSGSLELAAN